MIATYINTIAVIFGSLIGILLGGKIQKKYEDAIYTAIGLFVIVLGVKMAIGEANSLYLVISLVLGGLIGTALHIEEGILNLGNVMKKILPSSMADDSFSQGFLDASVIFCVGAMGIVGSFQAGVDGNYQLLLVKSVMDGCTSILLAAVLGWGVLFSGFTILIIQGLLTLLAGVIAPFVDQGIINAVSALGGVLVLMIGMNFLEIRSIKTANFIPSLVLIVIFQVLDPLAFLSM